MRISEIAPGEKRIVRTTKFDEVWNKLIVPNCSEILKIYISSDNLLYRGTKDVGHIFRGSSRTNRFPRDSYLLLNELFDVGLRESGMPALRSNSLFVSNSSWVAEDFGNNLYIIFPLDGFEYTWTKHSDIILTNKLAFLETWANMDVVDIIDRAWKEDSDNYRHYQNWLFDFELINSAKSLDANLSNINELLIRNNYPPIKAIDLIDIAKFRNYIGPQNTNLLDIMYASKYEHHEVMIKGSYYAFDVNFYENKIKYRLSEMD